MEKTECEVRKNNRWKWYRISLWVIMLLSVAAICMILLIDIYRTVPDTIYLKAGKEETEAAGKPGDYRAGKRRRHTCLNRNGSAWDGCG